MIRPTQMSRCRRVRRFIISWTSTAGSRMSRGSGERRSRNAAPTVRPLTSRPQLADAATGVAPGTRHGGAVWRLQAAPGARERGFASQRNRAEPQGCRGAAERWTLREKEAVHPWERSAPSFVVPTASKTFRDMRTSSNRVAVGGSGSCSPCPGVWRTESSGSFRTILVWVFHRLAAGVYHTGSNHSRLTTCNTKRSTYLLAGKSRIVQYCCWRDKDLRANGMVGNISGFVPNEKLKVLGLMCALLSRGAGNTNPTTGNIGAVSLYEIEQKANYCTEIG